MNGENLKYKGSTFLYWRKLPNETADCYVSGGAALNIGDPGSGQNGGAADWHGTESWITERLGEVVEHVGGRSGMRSPWDVIGREGIREGSEEVRKIGYPVPEGRKVSVATHTRAILDIAYTRWTRTKTRRPVPIGRAMVSDWIWSPAQMQELKAWIAATAKAVPADRRGTWVWWGKSLLFGASHEDYMANDREGGVKA